MKKYTRSDKWQRALTLAASTRGHLHLYQLAHFGPIREEFFIISLHVGYTNQTRKQTGEEKHSNDDIITKTTAATTALATHQVTQSPTHSALISFFMCNR